MFRCSLFVSGPAGPRGHDGGVGPAIILYLSYCKCLDVRFLFQSPLEPVVMTVVLALLLYYIYHIAMFRCCSFVSGPAGPRGHDGGVGPATCLSYYNV